ncbi:hypothetical protein BP6252_07530 [Coleophoma cylindrospora]|uniref:Uncharacterized protein n=1 Tax=Coleophoma cylindrospora TaxID=1849047 RepID=A0A3D8RA87_9HELO|nr:hypothetical protein BP6252_07530 [Coleophoma cylindrospora]
MTPAAASTGAPAAFAALNLSRGTMSLNYSSDLWLHHVARRCSPAHYLGIARLARLPMDHQYPANIVQISPSPHAAAPRPLEDGFSEGVGELVYYLAPADEAYLGPREHVPDHSTQDMYPTQFWLSENACPAPFRSATPSQMDVTQPLDPLNMIVYITARRQRRTGLRMSTLCGRTEGIHNALTVGVAKANTDRVIRQFISMCNLMS